MQSLSNYKATGLHEVVNEVLTMLPHNVSQTIYKLLNIIWASGYTPDTLKTSKTVFINKEETEITYFRPVGLANALYKLWTRMVTNTLYEYAEADCRLSTARQV